MEESWGGSKTREDNSLSPLANYFGIAHLFLWILQKKLLVSVGKSCNTHTRVTIIGLKDDKTR